VRLAKPNPASGLKMRKLTDYDMVVCASPSYLAEHGYPNDLTDLSRRACIVYRRSGGPSKWFFPRGGKLVDITPNAPHRLDDLETIAAFAKAGIGIAWLPPWLIKPDLDAGQLVPIFSDQPSLKSDVSLVWLDRPHMARRVRLAIDSLVASVSYPNSQWKSCIWPTRFHLQRVRALRLNAQCRLNAIKSRWTGGVTTSIRILSRRRMGNARSSRLKSTNNQSIAVRLSPGISGLRPADSLPLTS
jgi:hypothetical protein